MPTGQRGTSMTPRSASPPTRPPSGYVHVHRHRAGSRWADGRRPSINVIINNQPPTAIADAYTTDRDRSSSSTRSQRLRLRGRPSDHPDATSVDESNGVATFSTVSSGTARSPSTSHHGVTTLNYTIRDERSADATAQRSRSPTTVRPTTGHQSCPTSPCRSRAVTAPYASRWSSPSPTATPSTLDCSDAPAGFFVFVTADPQPTTRPQQRFDLVITHARQTSNTIRQSSADASPARIQRRACPTVTGTMTIIDELDTVRRAR